MEDAAPEDAAPEDAAPEDAAPRLSAAQSARLSNFLVAPHVQESIARALRPISEQVSASIMRAVQPSIVQFNARFAEVYKPFIEGYLGRIQASIASSIFTPEMREAIERLGGAVTRFIPDNLRSLRTEQWKAVLLVSSENRIGLAWSPRTEIVVQLLEAESVLAREEILIERAPEIVQDCYASIQEVSHSELGELSSFAVKAIDAYRAGHHEAAQALATNVLDTALEQKAGGVRAALKSLKQPLSDRDSIRRFRLLAAGAGIHPSYRDYQYYGRDPQYSRHGTAHAVNGELYRETNAIKAITLMASWLRFLDVLAKEQLPESVSKEDS